MMLADIGIAVMMEFVMNERFMQPAHNDESETRERMNCYA